MFCLLISMVALIIAFFLLSSITYSIAFYSNPKNRGDIMQAPPGDEYVKEGSKMGKLIRELEEIPYEKVSVTSYDGLKLCGKYYHVSDDAPVQIQFHGYRGSGIRDFCGGNKLARSMGHNTLLITQRAHGDSQGNTITFGIKEQYDCVAWIDYIRERFGQEKAIILSGVSMGAATVLMASGLNLPESVKCIIADSPYSSASGIIKKVCRDMKISPVLAYPFIYAGARIYGGIDLNHGDVCKAVSKSKTPILLIHGQADGFVPCDMSRKIYDSCSSAKFSETFPEAGHGISYIKDEERYAQVVKDFLNSVI